MNAKVNFSMDMFIHLHHMVYKNQEHHLNYQKEVYYECVRLLKQIRLKDNL